MNNALAYKVNPFLTAIKNGYGNPAYAETLIFEAIMEEDISSLDRLYNHGFQPDDKHFETAVLQGRHIALKFLLTKGADPFAEDYSAFQHAIDFEKHCLQVLVKHAAEHGMTPSQAKSILNLINSATHNVGLGKKGLTRLERIANSI